MSDVAGGVERVSVVVAGAGPTGQWRGSGRSPLEIFESLGRSGDMTERGQGITWPRSSDTAGS